MAKRDIYNPFRDNPVRGRTNAAVLRYKESVYTPYELKYKKTLSIEEQRAEYSRLRKIANKRLARIGESKYVKSPIYQYNVGKYVPLKDIKTNSELAYKLSDVARYLKAETSTLRGLENMTRRTVKTLQRNGINVTENKLAMFGDFMEYARTVLASMLYDSERIARIFNDIENDGGYTKEKGEQILKDYMNSRTRANNNNNNNGRSSQWMRESLK